MKIDSSPSGDATPFQFEKIEVSFIGNTTTFQAEVPISPQKQLEIKNIFDGALKGRYSELDTDRIPMSSLEKDPFEKGCKLEEFSPRDSTIYDLSSNLKKSPSHSMYQGNVDLPPNYFQDQTREIVKGTAEKITQAIDTESVISFFDELLVDLGEKRHDLAGIQKSEDRDLFGVIRRSEEGTSYPELITPLSGRYSKYGEKIRDSLQEIMKDEEIDSKKVVVQEMEISGFRTRAEITKNSERSYHLNTILIKGEDEYCVSSTRIAGFYDWVPIFTHSEESSQIAVKEFLATSFESCLNSDSEESLKQNVATFRYLFGHAAPYIRGSAAIAEWIEKAIYLQKEYEFDYTSGSADLDAMTSLSLAEFVDTYVSKAILTPAHST